MKTVWHGIQVILAAIGGWLGWFWGGFDGLVYALLVFVAVDYVTGFMCAVIDKKLSSEIGFKGIFKKVLIFTLVGIGHLVDRELIGSGEIIRTTVIFFYLSNEGISFLENATRVGLPVPQKLRDILSQLHCKSDGENQA